MGRWANEGESNSFKTYRTLYELLAFFSNETLRVGVRAASRREAFRREGVLVNQRCRRVSRRRRLVNPEGGSLRQAAKRLR